MMKSKKNPIKNLKQKAWKTLSEYIRRRDSGICFTCGKLADWKQQDCGHFIHNSERNEQLGGNALWYDERNFACQDFYCNRMRSGQGAIFAIKLKEKGIDIQELYQLYQTPKKWTVEEIEQVIEYYKARKEADALFLKN